MPTSSECINCKHPLPSDHSGPCPNCGGNVILKKDEDSQKFEDRETELVKESRHIKKNLLDTVLLALTIIVPLSCYYYVTPLLGTIVAILFGLGNYVASPYAKEKILKIDRTKYVYIKPT